MSMSSSLMGSAFQAVGSINQGNSSAALSDYNAQIAEQNANIADQQGAEEARRSLVNSRKFIGAATAAYGASGVTTDGSAMDVLRNSASQGELNALTIKNNADIKATAYRNQSTLDQFRAHNQRVAGYMGAATALLSGGSKAGSMSGGADAADDAGSLADDAAAAGE